MVGYGVNFTFAFYLPVLKGKANLGDIFQEKKNLSYEVGYNILESNFQLKITNLSSGFWRTKIPKQNLTEVLLS